jgi:hypothetical protein
MHRGGGFAQRPGMRVGGALQERPVDVEEQEEAQRL